MNIQFSDLKQGYLSIKDEIDTAIGEVLNEGNYILGRQVDEFQESFADYSGYEYCAGVSSGGSAIELLLRSMPIKRGSSVIIPANTFLATVSSAMAAGLKVVLADVDSKTQLLTWENVAKVLNDDVETIIGVNLFGRTVDEQLPIMAVATGLHFIYDACQSHGVYNPTHHSSAYSFYCAKNLGGICDGGAVCSNDKGEYESILSSRNYGSRQKYVHEIEGQNARIDTINASVLKVKLKYLNDWNANRTKVALLYEDLLCGVHEIRTPEIVKNTSWHLYVIEAEDRNDLQEYLKSNGVPVQIHYPIPIHRQPCFKNYDFGSNNSFPVTEHLSESILSLPIHPFMKTGEVEYICEKVKKFYR